MLCKKLAWEKFMRDYNAYLKRFDPSAIGTGHISNRTARASDGMHYNLHDTLVRVYGMEKRKILTSMYYLRERIWEENLLRQMH